MNAPAPGAPITVALVDDYDVVVIGVANILEQYRDRVVVAEIDTNESLSDQVDIVLYDAYAQPETDAADLQQFLTNPLAGRTAVYTWNFHPTLVEEARRIGVHGYLSKALPARAHWELDPAGPLGWLAGARQLASFRQAAFRMSFG